MPEAVASLVGHNNVSEAEEILQNILKAYQLDFSKHVASAKPFLPLSAYGDPSAFKTCMLDVGLLRRLAQPEPSIYTEKNRLFTEFKVSLAESFILTGLCGQFDAAPRYWRSGNKAEIDFVLQFKNGIIPIGGNKTIKSNS